MHLIVWLVVRDERGQVLLARRSGTRYGDGLWNLPGGQVEPGEGLREAACREALEEVGLEIMPADLSSLGASRYDVISHGEVVQGVDFFFEARRFAGTPQPLDYTAEVAWFAPGELPTDSLPWLPTVLGAHLGGAGLTEQLSGLAGVRVLD